MTELRIGPGTQVTLHFAIELEDGQLVDSTFDAKPATFVVGDGNMLEGFEKLLFGLSVGDKNRFDVLPEQGFGQHNPSNMQEIPRSAFEAGLELEEGLMVSFADAQNNELPGIVHSFDDDKVTVDFNHPLAGRDLVFEVDILDVQPAVTH